MALKSCEECGFIYSTHAKQCPQCGCPNPNILKMEELIESEFSEKQKIERSFGVMIITFIIMTFIYLETDSGIFFSYLTASVIGFIIAGIGTGILGFAVFVGLMSLGLSYVCTKLTVPESIQNLIGLIVLFYPSYYIFVRPLLAFVKLFKNRQKQNHLEK